MKSYDIKCPTCSSKAEINIHKGFNTILCKNCYFQSTYTWFADIKTGKLSPYILPKFIQNNEITGQGNTKKTA